MRRIVLIATVFAFVLTLGAVQVSADVKEHNNCFKWLRDADGDGIPNCLDEDWVRPQDGTGYMLGNGFGLFPGIVLTAAGGDKNQFNHHRVIASTLSL